MNEFGCFSDSFVQLQRFTTDGISSQKIPWPVYHAKFNVHCYEDNAFTHYGIDFPGSLSQAVVKRKAEYLAGRLAARQALAQAGVHDFPLHNSPTRDPQWPQAVTGSISHTGPHALAVACQKQPWQLSGIGLDIEAIISEKSAQRLWCAILSPDEKNLLEQTGLPFAFMVTLAFSVKEALFKALYPLLRQYLAFHSSAIIAFRPDDACLDLRLDATLTASGRIPDRVTGYYYYLDGNLVTLVCF